MLYLYVIIYLDDELELGEEELEDVEEGEEEGEEEGTDEEGMGVVELGVGVASVSEVNVKINLKNMTNYY